MGLIGSVIGAVGSGVSSIVGAISARNQQKRQQEWQTTENEKAYERQKEQIQRQNEYNSSAAQVSRLMAAGLSPNLVYNDTSSGEAGMQESIPEYQPAQSGDIAAAYGSQIGSAGRDMIESLIGLSDLDNQTKDTESKIALRSLQGFTEVSRKMLNDNTSAQILQNMGFDEQLFPYRLLTADAQYKNIEANTDKIYKEFSLTDAKVRELNAKAGLEISQTLKILTLLADEKEKIRAEIDLLRKQGKLTDANIQLVFAQSKYFREMAKNVSERLMLDRDTLEETIRHNKVVEGETHRHNVQSEEKDMADVQTAREGLRLQGENLAESIRHNKELEDIDWRKVGTEYDWMVVKVFIQALSMGLFF